MRVGLLLLSMTMVTACATRPETPRTAEANEEGLVCTTTVPTGSFLPERRCTTAAERADERRQNDLLIETRSERDSGIR
jgi:hypothetical protein